jgi:hypothetical protein
MVQGRHPLNVAALALENELSGRLESETAF